MYFIETLDKVYSKTFFYYTNSKTVKLVLANTYKFLSFATNFKIRIK